MKEPVINFDIPEEILGQIEMMQGGSPKEEDQKQAPKSAKPMSAAEKAEAKLLLDESHSFECFTVFGRLFGKKTRRWKIQQLRASTIVRINLESSNLVIDEEAINEHGVIEAKRLTVEHFHSFAKIAAIAVAGVYPFARVIEKILTPYFYKRLSPEAALNVIIIANGVQNLVDFCNSIRLTYARRLTEPALIEENTKG